jgi:uncharacterized membrane protein
MGHPVRIAFSRHAVAAALVGLLVLFVASASPNVQFGDPENGGDVGVYERYGERMRSGLIPYGDFYMEYPPLAAPVFAAPTIGAGASYLRNAKVLQALMASLSLVLVVVALALSGATVRHLYLAALAVAVSPILLGRITFTRYDFWPALLTIAALALATANRTRLGSGVLALGTLAKVYPAVLLPLFLLRADGERKGGWRAALVAFATVMFVVLAPFAVVGAGGLRFTLLAQVERPLQIETLGGSVALVLGRLGTYEPNVVFSYSSHNLVGGLPTALSAVSSLVVVLALGLIFLAFARTNRSSPDLLTAAAAVVCVYVTFGRVLSPQYLIWLIPLVPLVRGRTGVIATMLLFASMALTQVWSQGGYTELVYVERTVWLLLLRNVLMVVLAGLLVHRAVAGVPLHVPSLRFRRPSRSSAIP